MSAGSTSNPAALELLPVLALPVSPPVRPPVAAPPSSPPLRPPLVEPPLPPPVLVASVPLEQAARISTAQQVARRSRSARGVCRPDLEGRTLADILAP
jgi:hypothetical protein